MFARLVKVVSSILGKNGMIKSLVGEDAEGKRGHGSDEQYERVRHPRELVRVAARTENLQKE